MPFICIAIKTKTYVFYVVTLQLLYCIAESLMGENFDEWPVTCQKFPFQPFLVNAFSMKLTIN